MIKNYFKIAWRNLARNKRDSIINIGGLAVGMAVAMLIGLWIYDEVSFDKYNKNYNRHCTGKAFFNRPEYGRNKGKRISAISFGHCNQKQLSTVF